MKRLFAIFALLAGGVAAEITHPVQCSLALPEAGRLEAKRQKR